MLNEDGFRTQIGDSPVCDCGRDYESVEHFLLDCKLYSEYRTVMFEDIREVLQSRKDSRHVKISVGLLLGQSWEIYVTKSQNIKTKKSVFQFIAESKRKLRFAGQ